MPKDKKEKPRETDKTSKPEKPAPPAMRTKNDFSEDSQEKKIIVNPKK